MTGRLFLFALMIAGLLLALTDHLLSPPLHGFQGDWRGRLRTLRRALPFDKIVSYQRLL